MQNAYTYVYGAEAPAVNTFDDRMTDQIYFRCVSVLMPGGRAHPLSLASRSAEQLNVTSFEVDTGVRVSAHYPVRATVRANISSTRIIPIGG
jgi:hypothetical protein